MPLFRSRGRLLAALLVACWAAHAAPASAQGLDTGTIRGQVVDQTGGVLPGVVVVATNTATGQTRQTVTDHGGYYTLAALPLSGEYTLTFSLAGFNSSTFKQISLRAGESASVKVTLHAAGGSTSVTVVGTTHAIQRNTPQTGIRLNAQEIASIPVLGRALTALPLLNSAVVPARTIGDTAIGNTLFEINGAGRRETSYTIDGLSADDSWARQTIFTNVPLDAVQEMTVLTNGFSVEYGGGSGAAVNIVTKSGTNTLRGDVLGLWKPGGLEAKAPLAATSNADRLGQGAFTLGGPIVRDRAFYFLSGEYDDAHRNTTITSPLSPGTYTGTMHQELFDGRVDAHLDANNSLTFKANTQNYRNTNPSDDVGGLNLPSAARVFTRDTYSGAVSETSILSSSMLNEAHIGVDWASPITQYSSVTPSTQFVVPGLGTQGESRAARLYNHQFELKDTLTIWHGRHNVKVGVDAIHSTSGGNGTESGGSFTLGQFTLLPGTTAPIADLTPADVQRYQQSFGNATYQVQEWDVAAFAQDNFAIRSDLTLNLGLRYDRQTFTDDTKMFSPRLGFAYDVKGDPRTVVRGSYGLYFAQVPTDRAAFWTINGPQGIYTFSVAPGQYGFPTNLQALPSLPAGVVLPPRNIYVRPGDAAYLSQFFDVSKLKNYPSKLLNPRTQQFTIGIERDLGNQWVASADYVHARTTDIYRPIDLNAPAPFVRTAPGQVRSAAAADATRPIPPVPGGYRQIITFVNDGRAAYDGLQLNLSKHFSDGVFLSASYTLSHATDTVDADVPIAQQAPNDENLTGAAEQGPSILNEPQRAVITGSWTLSALTFGGVATLGSGLPYNITTGVDNNGDGFNSDRPVVNGAVIERNSGVGSPLYDVSPFVERDVRVGSRLRLQVRAEAFNLFNHANIYSYNGVYGNSASGQPLASFGQPVGGINGVGPGREFQFMARLLF